MLMFFAVCLLMTKRYLPVRKNAAFPSPPDGVFGKAAKIPDLISYFNELSKIL